MGCESGAEAGVTNFNGRDYKGLLTYYETAFNSLSKVTQRSIAVFEP